MTKIDAAVDQPDQPVVSPSAKPVRLLILSLGLVLLLAVGGFAVWWFLPPTLHGVVLESPREVPNFTLTASTGEPIQLSDLRGKFVLIYFGYTFCPDACPMALNDLKAMAQSLGERRMEDVEVVLITVDPERDTVEQLASYLKYIDPSFIGMTGSMEDIRSVASQFGIFFEKQDVSGGSSYLVDHSSAITVVDPDGHIRMLFRSDITPDEMAEDMGYLLRRF